MSGECDKCGEHGTECRCNQSEEERLVCQKFRKEVFQLYKKNNLRADEFINSLVYILASFIASFEKDIQISLYANINRLLSWYILKLLGEESKTDKDHD